MSLILAVEVRLLRGKRIVRGRPPLMSIALRQSQMDIFDFISPFLFQPPRIYSARGGGSDDGAMAGTEGKRIRTPGAVA